MTTSRDARFVDARSALQPPPLDANEDINPGEGPPGAALEQSENIELAAGPVRTTLLRVELRTRWRADHGWRRKANAQ